MCISPRRRRDDHMSSSDLITAHVVTAEDVIAWKIKEITYVL